MDINEVLTRGVDKIYPDKPSLEKLAGSKKIRVYLGVDPTGTKLHLGHAIPLRKLNEFAKLGHEAILLFGTGTVLAGDPSQRSQARKRITREEIEENIKNWKQQAGKIIDLGKVQIKQNGDWLLKLGLADIIDIASNISATQLFKRDMFQRRIDAGDIVYYHETLYPLLQGYDSVALDTDLEIGGTDQTFNMLIGRELMKKMKNKEKFVLTTPLINGTNGKPMSKSSGNCIWLDDRPSDVYGKILSLPDSEIEPYWTLLTDLSQNELKTIKPLEAKKKLAYEIVRQLDEESEAKKAQENFENVFQKREIPQEVREIKVEDNTTIVDLLTANGIISSSSQVKNLIKEKAIDIDGKIVENPKEQVKTGQLIKVGKKTFVKTI
jgi:tyrosyl-tRNA synthetase